MKGVATLRLQNGSLRMADLHWYEAHGIGKRKMKIKRLLDGPSSQGSRRIDCSALNGREVGPRPAAGAGEAGGDGLVAPGEPAVRPRGERDLEQPQ